MAEKIDEIDLDLTQITVLSWQKEYCQLTVNAIKEGIKLGHEIPRADVVLIDDSYQFVYGRGQEYCKNYGGHHRLLAFNDLKEQHRMPCNLFDSHRENLPTNQPIITMQQMTPSDIPSYERLRDALSYLPKRTAANVIRNFCKTRGLSIRDFID